MRLADRQVAGADADRQEAPEAGRDELLLHDRAIAGGDEAHREAGRGEPLQRFACPRQRANLADVAPVGRQPAGSRLLDPRRIDAQAHVHHLPVRGVGLAIGAQVVREAVRREDLGVGLA